MANKKERQKNILDFMRREIKEKGYPPTVREICSALGIKSTSTVHKDIEDLVDDGFLIKDPTKPRALMLVSKDEDKKDEIKELAPVREDITDIPVVGRVAAGQPITAEQNIEEYFPVPAAYCTGTNFMLRVSGESMIEAGILDGDLILVQEQHDARNGEIVVAMVDGFESEATVKTFFREKDHIRLQPENSSMSPIIVKDVKILGKVKGVFRYFS